MKRFNLITTIITVLITLNCFGQISVNIQSLQYTNNGQSQVNSSSCGDIDLESSTSTSVSFGVNLSKPNGLAVGSGKIIIYTLKSSNDTRKKSGRVLRYQNHFGISLLLEMILIQHQLVLQ
jgi:hypothetical protein